MTTLNLSGSNNNQNLNAQGSVYAAKYTHNVSDLVARVMTNRKKKIYDAKPKQYRPQFAK